MNFENDPLGEMSISAMEEQGQMEPPCSCISDIQSDVRSFMHAFNQHVPHTPQWPDQATMDLRVRLMSEEYMETVSSMGYNVFVGVSNLDGCWVYENEFTQAHHNCPNMPETADGLIDLLYGTIGSLLAMGIDMWPLWAEVQRANMAKTGGPKVNGKQMKPAGWTPPDIEGLLRKQGWEDEDGR